MPEKIQSKLIEEEMKESYIDYAMSVITARALPDVRDGLKPVHRRVLFAMDNLGLQSNKPTRKSARIVGEVLGKYHPHGDIAVYDALVRMAQDFSLRYPLVDGQGNFGNIDGDSAAAQRYTEVRLSKIAEEMLADIEKNTVDFIPNYDNSTKEPVVLPAKLPNLLINGSSGIAVGMATNIPPHNISEVIDAIIALIDNPEITLPELMNYIKGPDFPTGAYIYGRSSIKHAYSTGKSLINVRAKTLIEEKDNKKIIVVRELPYQVNKTVLIENIADLIRDKKIIGITNLRDESDREGMRIVIELSKNTNEDVVLNQLYKHTQLQTTFGVNMLALVNGEPKLLSLNSILNYYILHRKKVIERRTKFDLNKAEERTHILTGLKIALNNIDNVVAIIKKSKNVEVARDLLINNFDLTEIQANSILDMKLQKITSLETEKIKKEYDELIKLIEELKGILASEEKILLIIKNELLDLRKKYSDGRRTEIVNMEETLETEDLIKQEDIVITITHSGYIKSLPSETYKQQKRGGRGIIATAVKEEDFVEHLFITNTHDYILFFTDKGKVHWLKAYQIPSATRYAKGINIVNLLKLEDEKITAAVPIKEFLENKYLVMVTKNGLIKKTKLIEYSNIRKTGIIALNLKDEDKLINVRLTDGDKQLIIATKNGLAVKFNESNVRSMGRNATGVRAVKLIEDYVIGMEICDDNDTLLTITENGYGKRSLIADYRLIRRGGKGVINIKTTERNGKVVSIKVVNDNDGLMFITKNGVLISINVKDISTIGRNTKGVRIMKLNEQDKVVDIAKIIK